MNASYQDLLNLTLDPDKHTENPSLHAVVKEAMTKPSNYDELDSEDEDR